MAKEIKQRTYAQKFRKQWLQDDMCKDWIAEVPTDERSVLCKYCKTTFRAKYYDIKDHAKSKKHQVNSAPFSSSRQAKISFPKVEKSRDVARAEAHLALFVAKHCAISSCDHLVDVVKKCFSDKTSEVAKLAMHRTKCTAILKHVLMPHFVSKLKEDIGDRKYSILLDESTDIAVHKYLGLAIHYFSEHSQTLVSTFLHLAPLQECDASGIVDALKTSLHAYRLDLQNMIGIGTDNASVMVGINNGVYKQLKEEVPSLVHIRCVCHSVQLAVSHASSATLPRNLEFLVSETYNWFARSSTRQVAYKDLFKLINDGHEPLKIVQACQTRWLSIASAVQRLCDQWLELKTHFSLTKTSEKCYNSEMLHAMYSDDFNYAYMLFLKSVLSEVQRVNKAFESNNRDPSKLLDDLTLLIESLVNRVILPTNQHRIDPFTCNLNEYVAPKVYLGYETEKLLSDLPKHASANLEGNLQERCKEFLLTLITELRHRLPDNVRVLRTMSLFSVGNTLRVVKNSIAPLLEVLNVSAEDITKIELQWSNITLVKWFETKDTVKFWAEVSSYKDASNKNPYHELSSVALTVLSLPHSNAEIERVFSQMNIIKTKLRNKMQTDTTNALLHIRYGLKRMSQTCVSYDLPNDVLDLVASSQKYSQSSAANEPSTSSASAEEQDDEVLSVIFQDM